MTEAWSTLAPGLQGALILIALLVPLIVLAFILMRGFALFPLLFGLLRKHLLLAVTFIGLIAFSVAMGVGITAQERGLREGSARAAQKFDIVVAAPGSEYSAMLATVFLETQALPLIGGDVFDALHQHPNVDFAAPLAFGDSFEGAPVVGTTTDFIAHLSAGLQEGRVFEAMNEAVLGADIDIELGDSFEPIHGDGSQGVLDEHGFAYTAVGRAQPTGSPWDKAILVSVESVWDIHSLPTGHGPDWDGELGPPFIADAFPGTPAILVKAKEFWANYALRSEFTTPDTMAFFPGTVLADLYAVMGDIRRVMSALALATQTLVAVAVIAGLAMLMRLLAPRMAMLRAAGAPPRFIVALTWCFATALILVGAFIGLGLAVAVTQAISSEITARTDIVVEARLTWRELHLVAGFVSACSILTLLPALGATRSFQALKVQ